MLRGLLRLEFKHIFHLSDDRTRQVHLCSCALCKLILKYCRCQRETMLSQRSYRRTIDSVCILNVNCLQRSLCNQKGLTFQYYFRINLPRLGWYSVWGIARACLKQEFIFLPSFFLIFNVSCPCPTNLCLIFPFHVSY